MGPTGIRQTSAMAPRHDVIAVRREWHVGTRSKHCLGKFANRRTRRIRVIGAMCGRRIEGRARPPAPASRWHGHHDQDAQRKSPVSAARLQLDRWTTGTVLHRNIDGLADLEARLTRIGLDRQWPRADWPLEEDGPSSCPSCGTRRIGQFRWCTSCGNDFEPTLHGGPLWSQSGLPEPDPTATPTGRLEDFRLPPLAPGVPQDPGFGPVLGHDRSRRVGIPFWDRGLTPVRPRDRDRSSPRSPSRRDRRCC